MSALRGDLVAELGELLDELISALEQATHDGYDGSRADQADHATGLGDAIDVVSQRLRAANGGLDEPDPFG